MTADFYSGLQKVTPKTQTDSTSKCEVQKVRFLFKD